MQKRLSGWAATHFAYSRIITPIHQIEVVTAVNNTRLNGSKIISRGSGKSYGDQALNKGECVIDMSRMDKILVWDKESGLLTAESGITLEKILDTTLRDNWILPVIPGTRYVSLGGALANNVHGKNSYKNGNFGKGILEFKTVLASGEILTCSRTDNADIFFATIGGAGLLGIVTEVTLQLAKIPSPYISIKKNIAHNLTELLGKLEQLSKEDDFAIAQVDCFSKKNSLGRGTVHAGIFDAEKREPPADMTKISKNMFGIFPKKIIIKIGKYLLNNHSMRLIT